jgi:hypothetical protein
MYRELFNKTVLTTGMFCQMMGDNFREWQKDLVEVFFNFQRSFQKLGMKKLDPKGF